MESKNSHRPSSSPITIIYIAKQNISSVFAVAEPPLHYWPQSSAAVAAVAVLCVTRSSWYISRERASTYSRVG